MPNIKYGDCTKCSTKYVPLTEFNGQWLCDVNLCLTEELEKINGKAQQDLDNLEDYRKLVAGTKNIPASGI